jgi:hypothetical protein
LKSYITKFNANRIISTLDHRIWYEDTYFQKMFKWLNIREVSELQAYRYLFFNPDEILSQYKKIETSKNIFVFESVPSYHRFNDCDLLKSSFENFRIPETIQSEGVDKVNEYRQFFVDNKDLVLNHFDFFKDKIKWKFGINCVPEKINLDNSGTIETENLTIEEITSRLKLVLKKTKEFINSSSKNKSIIDKFGEKSFLSENKTSLEKNTSNFSDEEIWEVLFQFNEQCKKPFKNYIIDFMRISSKNPELKFENKILDQLGLYPCQKCENKFMKQQL